MTAKQLTLLRKDRGLTREQLAHKLGVSYGAIVNWELRGTPIPDWVERELLAQINVTLPLNELTALIAHCKEWNLSPQQMLANCIRSYIGGGVGDNVPPLPLNTLDDQEDTALVAEDPVPYPTPSPKKKLTPNPKKPNS